MNANDIINKMVDLSQACCRATGHGIDEVWVPHAVYDFIARTALLIDERSPNVHSVNYTHGLIYVEAPTGRIKIRRTE